MRRRMRTVGGDRGETLLELIVTVTIMGIAVVAVIGGLGVSILMSDIHRKQAAAGSVVQNYAEAVQAWVTAGHYNATPSPNYSPATVGFTAPAGFTASVKSVRCWSGSWGACTTDHGLQEVTVQAWSNEGDCAAARACENLTLILRKPCREPSCA